MSVKEYKMIKLGRLQTEVGLGLEQLDRNESTVFDKAGLDDLFDGLQAKGRARRNAMDIEPLAKVWVDKMRSHFEWILRLD